MAIDHRCAAVPAVAGGGSTTPVAGSGVKLIIFAAFEGEGAGKVIVVVVDIELGGDFDLPDAVHVGDCLGLDFRLFQRRKQ